MRAGYKSECVPLRGRKLGKLAVGDFGQRAFAP